MKRLCFVIGICACSFSVVAAGGSRLASNDATMTTSSNGSGENDVISVKGTGTGETEDVALKDAYRDAVETAVGLYVDAEQMAKNDEVIKDEILTQSNAYIENCDVLSKETKNGLVKIKILAKVRKQALTKKISGSMKAKTVKVGGGLKNLHAQMTTTEKKSGDGAALLAKALEGVDPMRQLMEASLVTGEAVQVQNQNGPTTKRGRNASAADIDTVELAYLFKFEINRDRYFKEFLPNLERVLTQVAEHEPKEVSINTSAIPEYRDKSDSYCRADGSLARNALTHGELGGVKRLETSSLGCILPGSHGRIDRASDVDGALVAIVVTDATENLSSVRAKAFRLDEACAEVVCEFENKSAQNKYKVAARKPACVNGNGLPVYLVSFCDSDGKVICSREISIPRSRSGMKDLLSSVLWSRSLKCRGDFWFVTPFVGGQAKAYYQWFSFKLPKEDLPKIDSIKVELAE